MHTRKQHYREKPKHVLNNIPAHLSADKASITLSSWLSISPKVNKHTNTVVFVVLWNHPKTYMFNQPFRTFNHKLYFYLKL